MDKSFFKKNREKLYSSMKDDSVCILFAGKAPVKKGDERYPFSPDSNFYYFTGIDKENIIAVFVKKNSAMSETLFIERSDRKKAKWVGNVISEKECRKRSAIKEIEYLSEFKEKISNIIFEKNIHFLYLDLENRYFEGGGISHRFAKKIKEEYPHINIENIYYDTAKLRSVKNTYEEDNIRKAIEITKNGIYSMMKNSKPGMYEYEIEAYFDFELKKNGVREKAFESIAASGKNATTLHYSENNSKTEDGDLILFDVGAKYGHYSADITRTFPVNGKFTKRQREIYDIVLEGQKKVKEAIKPGIPFKRLNEVLTEHYETELKKIGLIKDKKEVRKYYYHGVSHLLGLETHDAGRHNEGELKVGMVLTVEPGLYIEEENIGIRIEDDVIVRENGCEVLSEDIIRSADDIEEFMAK
ncbi:MAG: aminopeptidase P family protein [Firmicutes bacterium]|nr:aminopeptidase P family protein [Bacillota bacterium]